MPPEISKEERQAIVDEATEQAKTKALAEFTKQAKEDVDKINTLITDQRKEYDKFLKGKLTESDFKASEVKRLEAEKELKDRIDTLETKLKRPGLEDPEQKAGIPGAAEYKKSFFNYLRTGRMEMDEKAQKHFDERKALVSNTSGQILITEEVEAEIYRALPKLNVIRKYATIRTITSNRIRRRSLTEVAMGWGKLELDKEPVEQDVVPGEDHQYVEDLEGLARIGKDELADTDVSLEAMIVDSFARAKAETEETAFVKGTGHDYSQPEGIAVNTEISTVLTTASDVIDLDAVLGTIYALPAQYRKNGAFLASSPTMLAMRKLKDQDHQYLWQPSVQAGQPATIMGYPIEAQEDLDAPSAANENVIGIFGDFKAGYRILDRQGMMVQRMVEMWATAGLIGILVSSRVTGGVIRTDAFRMLKLRAG